MATKAWAWFCTLFLWLCAGYAFYGHNAFSTLICALVTVRVGWFILTAAHPPRWTPRAQKLVMTCGECGRDAGDPHAIFECPNAIHQFFAGKNGAK